MTFHCRWFLGNEEITHSSTQTNATDVSKLKTFVASSLLHYTFEKVSTVNLLNPSVFGRFSNFETI